MRSYKLAKNDLMCRLGHLVNYGASYYSYVYAQFIAGAVWKQHFADDPLSREAGTFDFKGLGSQLPAHMSCPGCDFCCIGCAGEHVRSRLLDLGGSKEPTLLIGNLLGHGSLQRIGRGWAPSPELIASGNVL